MDAFAISIKENLGQAEPRATEGCCRQVLRAQQPQELRALRPQELRALPHTLTYLRESISVWKQCAETLVLMLFQGGIASENRFLFSLGDGYPILSQESGPLGPLSCLLSPSTATDSASWVCMLHIVDWVGSPQNLLMRAEKPGNPGKGQLRGQRVRFMVCIRHKMCVPDSEQL